MSAVIFYAFLGIILGSVFAKSIHDEGIFDKQSRVLPFLAVVSFPNSECTAGTKDGDPTGICYSKKQCREKGGKESSTPCAQNYGICCTFERNCTEDNVIVKNNLTVLTSIRDQKGCNYIIPKQKGVCQIRLDFQSFMVGSVMEYANQAPVPPVGGPPPDVPDDLDPLHGECSTEKMTISPTQNLPDGLTLCGAAKDQHLYLHYGNSDKITLGMNLLANSASTYALKVTMIKCGATNAAPQGCTQWYREKSRRITSFNYPYAQLNREMYSACIDNPEGSSTIRWMACPPEDKKITSFFVTGLDPYTEKSGNANCKTDYVLLPGTDGERYCGGNFTKVVQSKVIPFMLWVNFNNEEVPKELSDPPEENDDVTGCPLGYVCLPAPDGVCTGTAPTGTCTASSLLNEQVDNYNLGFCLQYAI